MKKHCLLMKNQDFYFYYRFLSFVINDNLKKIEMLFYNIFN